MLKRQRPASPSPFYDRTEDEKSLPEDLFEPMSKRRRYFTPAKFNSSCNQLSPSEDYDDEDECRAGPSQSPSRRDGVREWQQHAGEYKEENSKLHDLHAEQRHRILFTRDSSAGRALLASLSSNMDSNEQVAAAQHPESIFKDSIHTSDIYVNAKEEAEVVSRRYEDTNKLLGSLFLSRRRATEHVSEFS